MIFKQGNWKHVRTSASCVEIEIVSDKYISVYCCRCAIPECDATNNTHYDPPWLPNAVPFANDAPSKCMKFVINNATENFENCNKASDFTTQTQRCHSFVYKTQEKSILQEVRHTHLIKVFHPLVKISSMTSNVTTTYGN